VVDPEKGTGLGMASGVLCLVRALLLHELDRITAWGEDNVMVEVPEQHRYLPFSKTKYNVMRFTTIRYCLISLTVMCHVRTAAALDFKVTAKDLKAFKLAVR
jgi:hypothetical protein